ncbi:hypothetical protein Ciccas_007376 [Cichlidogyrus casuarinus]|uniref:Tetraspanin n=1 Tax=Cichlidogyrus casuarinus TaxID=1844966 RepID=A0ABD2Q334_9PLAT
MVQLSPGYRYIKITLGIVNLLILIFGLALLGFGVVIHMNVVKTAHQYGIKNHLVESIISAVQYLSAIGLILACIIVLISFLGCCGALKEIPSLLIAFAVLMSIIFAILSVLTVVVFMLRHKFIYMSDMHELIASLLNFISLALNLAHKANSFGTQELIQNSDQSTMLNNNMRNVEKDENLEKQLNKIKNSKDGNINEMMKKLMKNVLKEDELENLMPPPSLMLYLKCCGIDKPPSAYRKLHPACCGYTEHIECKVENAYKQNCTSAIFNLINNSILGLDLVLLSLVFISLISIIMASCLTAKIRKNREA